ncbi:WHRN protein, partial [Amia calva]|nr:WHRN protein [Amia calva]
MSLNSSSANSVGSGGRSLSANVRKLHNALNLLLSEFEREQFIHCLNVYHSKRNVFDLVQTLKVILNAPSKRQLLPMLRLVIPRSDQLLFDQYTSEGLYLKSELLTSNGNLSPDGPVEATNANLAHNATPSHGAAQPTPGLLRASPDSFSTSSEGTAPSLAPLLGRPFLQEMLPGEIRQVCLKRHKSNEGLGFSIRGGSEHGVGIYVSLVEPGSLAEKEGLRVGDQILRVNDKVFERVTHAEAVKVSVPVGLCGSELVCLSVSSVSLSDLQVKPYTYIYTLSLCCLIEVEAFILGWWGEMQRNTHVNVVSVLNLIITYTGQHILYFSKHLAPRKMKTKGIKNRPCWHPGIVCFEYLVLRVCAQLHSYRHCCFCGSLWAPGG